MLILTKSYLTEYMRCTMTLRHSVFVPLFGSEAGQALHANISVIACAPFSSVKLYKTASFAFVTVVVRLSHSLLSQITTVTAVLAASHYPSWRRELDSVLFE